MDRNPLTTSKPSAGMDDSFYYGRRSGTFDSDKASPDEAGAGRSQFLGTRGLPAALPRKTTALSSVSDVYVPPVSGDTTEPYDPVTNPYVPRPIYLWYDPNKRRGFLQRPANGSDDRADCCVRSSSQDPCSSSSSSSSSLPSSPSSAVHPGSSVSAEGPNGAREVSIQEEDTGLEEEEGFDVEESEDEEEVKERSSFAKSILKGLFWATFLLVSYLCISSAPYSSTTPSAKSEYENFLSPSLISVNQFPESSEMCQVRGLETLTRCPFVCPAEPLRMIEPPGEEEMGRDLISQLQVTKTEEESGGLSKMMADEYNIGSNMSGCTGEGILGVRVTDYLLLNPSSVMQLSVDSEICRVKGPEEFMWFRVVCSAELRDVSEHTDGVETGRNLELQLQVTKALEKEAGSPSDSTDIVAVAAIDSLISVDWPLNLTESPVLEEEHAENLADRKGEGETRPGEENEGSNRHHAEAVVDTLHQVNEEDTKQPQESISIGNVLEGGLSKSGYSPLPLMKLLAVIFSVLSVLLYGILCLVAVQRRERQQEAVIRMRDPRRSSISIVQTESNSSKERLVVTPSTSHRMSLLQGRIGAAASSQESKENTPTTGSGPFTPPVIRSAGGITHGIRPPLVELLGELDFSGRKTPLVEMLDELDDFSRKKTERRVSERAVPLVDLKNRAGPTVSDGGFGIAISRCESPTTSANRSPSSRFVAPQHSPISGAEIHQRSSERKELEGRRKRMKESSSPLTPSTLRRSARIRSRASSCGST